MSLSPDFLLFTCGFDFLPAFLFLESCFIDCVLCPLFLLSKNCDCNFFSYAAGVLGSDPKYF